MISQEKCTRPTDLVNNSSKFRHSSSPRAAIVFCGLNAERDELYGASEENEYTKGIISSMS
jgi:hypothetical protein